MNPATRVLICGWIELLCAAVNLTEAAVRPHHPWALFWVISGTVFATLAVVFFILSARMRR